MVSEIEFQPDLGESGWVGLLPARRPGAALVHDVEADYCIVGAGFAGLAAARRIRQLDPEASIAILEARSVSHGPAGRNSGFMIDLPHVLASSSYAGQANQDRRDIQLNRSAINFVSDVVDEFDIPIEAFRRDGKVNGAVCQSGVTANQTYARHLDKLNEEYNLLDSQAMQALTGSDYYKGGLSTPGTVMIQPALLVQKIADGLSADDRCSLFERSPVISMESLGERWKLKTECGSVLATQTILAVNGFIENFGFYQRRLMHVNLYASLSRELSQDEVDRLGGAPRWGITPSDPFGSTVRRISGIGGNRLLIRNRITFAPSLAVKPRQLKAAVNDHYHSFANRFPMLPRVEMEYRWSGRLCLSQNQVWALGEVAPGIYSACCQNGLGATKGVTAGVIAAEQAFGGKTDSLMPEYEQEEMPARLFPEPFLTAGATTYLKIREWRAGRNK